MLETATYKEQIVEKYLYNNISFPFDEIFNEKREYLTYTFDVYNKLYDLKKIKYRCDVSDNLFSNIQEKSFFVLLVLYDENGKIYLSRSIKEKLEWSLPGGSILENEDIHASLRRIARKICPNFNEVIIGEIEPIVFIENEFCNNNKTHTHRGMAFIARVRDKKNVDLNNPSGDFFHLNDQDLSGVNKYANREVVKLAIDKINRINYAVFENEIATNEKYKFRYLVHNLFVKKFIITPRLKRKKQFISLIREKINEAKSLIDVSCGDSNLINEAITDDFDYVVANDISWSQIDLIAKRNKKIIFTNHNAVQLPFKDNAFDVAYCGNTLHHMPSKKDLLGLLDGIYKVANKILIVEVEKPQDTGLIPYLLNKFWYRGFLKDVGGAYLSKNIFQDIITRHFRGRADIKFSEFKNIQGRYLIAEINKFSINNMTNGNLLEAEAKFECYDIDKLKILCEEKGFEKQKSVKEIDDYFIDGEKTFIKDRTCLRFRNKDGQLEFTYKGRSQSNSHSFIKNEYNLPISSIEYEEKIDFLESLGFFKYVTVVKRREHYTKEEGLIVKNILIDHVEGVGRFVEFEIIVKEKEKIVHEELEKALDKFIDDFREVGLKEATLPYRDYVAKNQGENKLI